MKPSTQSIQPLFQANEESAIDPVDPVIPDYLQKVYWWAYLHPNGVRLFEREWLVNLILWGNFRKLRDAALAEFDAPFNHHLLQIACVYGDFTQRIANRLGQDGRLDVVDVAPIQLTNLRAKLSADERIALHRQDSSALLFTDASVDSTLIFFLLHEQPESVRRATLAEALRVTRPGGKIVIVDYHNPSHGNLLRYPMKLVLEVLEPFACDLWKNEIESYLPKSAEFGSLAKTCYFGGLYQKVVITR